MKKILAFILLFSLSFAMISCGDDAEVYDWKGDWNDPKDPNYKPEGYNPIKGIWKERGKTTGIYFSDDFKLSDVAFYDDGSYKITTFVNTYIINNEALRYQLYPETNRYKLNAAKDTLKITPYLFEDKGWVTYARFEPKEEN